MAEDATGKDDGELVDVKAGGPIDRSFDVEPKRVSREAYEDTKGKLEGRGYRVVTIEQPRSVGDLQREGLLSNNAHAADTLRDFTPGRIEVAIDPKIPFIPDSGGKTLEEQQRLRREFEASFHDDDPDYNVEGVVVEALPAAVVAAIDLKYLKEERKPLIPAKVTRAQNEDGEEDVTVSGQFVACSDVTGKAGNSWVATFGRFGTKEIGALGPKADTQPQVGLMYDQKPQPNVHALRAVILPQPIE